MPIVHQCSYPGCPTLTMGVRCLEHELIPTGRPLPVAVSLHAEARTKGGVAVGLHAEQTA